MAPRSFVLLKLSSLVDLKPNSQINQENESYEELQQFLSWAIVYKAVI